MDENSYLEVSDIILGLTGIIVCIYTWLTHKIWESYLAHLEFLKAQVDPVLSKVTDGELENLLDEPYMMFLVENAGACISSITFTSSENYRIELVAGHPTQPLIVWDSCQRGEVRIYIKHDLFAEGGSPAYQNTMHYTNVLKLRRHQELIFQRDRPLLYP